MCEYVYVIMSFSIPFWHVRLLLQPCNCDNVNALISLSYILSGHAAKRLVSLAILIDLYLFYSFDVFPCITVSFFNFYPRHSLGCVLFWMNISSFGFPLILVVIQYFVSLPMDTGERNEKKNVSNKIFDRQLFALR